MTRRNEEVCKECQNTNGEHKPWCSRYPGRHDRVPQPEDDPR